MKQYKCAVACATALLLVSGAVFAQIPDGSVSRDAMRELGLQHPTAESLYAWFKDQAKGGDNPGWEQLPDWSGVYSMGFGESGLAYDTSQRAGQLPPAKLIPEQQAIMEERVRLASQGIEFDPLGRCEPPGAPRGVSEPFLREYAVRPEQTWLMNEVAAENRRIYTDGRDHLLPEDRFPTFDGDSIGFWSEGKLVIHTNQLREGMYQRAQPNYSSSIELVEIMQKVDATTMLLHIWAYDPEYLLEPWYSQKQYVKLTDPEKLLRIHYWYCFDNQNNAVEEQEDGSTQFIDFEFDN